MHPYQTSIFVSLASKRSGINVSAEGGNRISVYKINCINLKFKKFLLQKRSLINSAYMQMTYAVTPTN